MQGESDSFDELLMQLVESALCRPAAQRVPFIESACAGDEILRKQVLERVQWEERMAGFLQQPVLQRVQPALPLPPPLKTSPRLPAAFALVCLAATFAVSPRAPVSASPPARLAILASANSEVQGALIDFSERLEGLREGLFVLPPQPAAETGVTHVLSVLLSQESVQAAITDGATRQVLHQWQGELADLPNGLEQLARTAFRISRFPPHRTSAAWPLYNAGLFPQAAQKDPHWAMPWVRLAERELQSRNIEEAGRDAARARSLEDGKVPALLVSGAVEEARKRFPQAAAFYEQAVRAVPAHSVAWRRLASARSKSGLPNEAMEAWQKALSVQPLDYQGFTDSNVLRP